jgi:hypothetical protein
VVCLGRFWLGLRRRPLSSNNYSRNEMVMGAAETVAWVRIVVRGRMEQEQGILKI